MTLPSYQTVISKIAKLNPPVALEIEKLLNDWRSHSSMGMRIVDNLKNEHQLPVNEMERLLDTLHANRHLPLTDLETTIYEKACYSMSLKGPQIDPDKVSDRIGGAKTADEFIAALGKRIKFGGTTRAAQIVSKLCSDTEDLSSGEKAIKLSDYAAWATWSEDSPDPFDFVSSPDEILKIIINLGLAHRQEGMSHLLFVYSREAASPLHIPTIADACLYSYFKCTDGQDYCGRTQPWNPEEVRHRKISAHIVKPRPEGVHSPIQLGDLEKPVRVIKGTVGTHYTV